MARWAAEIAPHHDLPEFIVAAQALSGNRELKHFLTDVRLTELRQVSDAWTAVREEKKRKKRKVDVNLTDDDQPTDAHLREGDAPQPHAAQGESDTRQSAAEHNGKERQVNDLLKDPDVVARIQRNRRLAIERRKAAANRNLRPAQMQSAPPLTVPLSSSPQGGTPDCIDIDPNDVLDVQEDIDMNVLDEIEHQQNAAALSQAPVELEDGSKVTAKNTAATSSFARNDSVVPIQKPSKTLLNDDKRTEFAQNGPKPAFIGPVTNKIVISANTKLQSPGAFKPSDSNKSSINIDRIPSAVYDRNLSEQAAVVTGGQKANSERSKEVGTEPEKDVDMDILDEFEAGVEEDY